MKVPSKNLEWQLGLNVLGLTSGRLWMVKSSLKDGIVTATLTTAQKGKAMQQIVRDDDDAWSGGSDVNKSG